MPGVSLSKYCFFIVVFCLVAGVCRVEAQQQSDTLWRAEYSHKIMAQKITPHGVLIVVTDRGLMGVNDQTGDSLWFMEAPRNTRLEDLVLIPNQPRALIVQTLLRDRRYTKRDRRVAIVDYTSGHMVFNSGDYGLKAANGQYLMRDERTVMIYAKREKGGMVMLAVDAITGGIVWENERFFHKCGPPMFKVDGCKTIVGNKPPVYDTDTTMITLMNKKKMRRWDVRTGELIWETEVKSGRQPSVQDGYAPLAFNDDSSVVYAGCERKVYAIRTKDGAHLWEKGAELEFKPRKIQAVPEGVLVQCAERKNDIRRDVHFVMLDTERGEILWREKVEDDKHATDFLVDGDRAVFYTDKKLLAVNIADGSSRVLSADVDFKEGEHPRQVREYNGAYLLSSPQNLMLVDITGETLYSVHHRSVDATTLEWLGALGLSLAVTGLTAGITGTPFENALVIPIPIEFRDTRVRVDHVYMLANVKVGNATKSGIIKVSKGTGETLAQVVIPKRISVFEIDDRADRMFVTDGKKELVCVGFGAVE